jgi:hypothetical protein
MEDFFSHIGPRLRGINEHYERVTWFAALADKADNNKERFRLLISSLYSARAIIELMFEAAERQEVPGYLDKDAKKCRKNFEPEIASRITHYSLVERIRIHDFHRYGVIPPNPDRQELFFGGPITLKANRGGAELSIPETGPQLTLSGSSSIKDQRSLCNANGEFFDDISEKYLPLGQIVGEFLESVPEALKWFQHELAM